MITDDIIREVIEAQGWQAGAPLVIVMRPSRRRRLWEFITRRKQKPRLLHVWAYTEPYEDTKAIKVDYGEYR